jgi:hypothetical protein
MYTYLLSIALFGGDVHRLGADEFAVREAAEARLSRHAWLAAPLCRWPYRDPERRRRAQRVVRRYEGWVNPPGGVWPCIGALTREISVQDDDEGRPWIQPTFERFYRQPCGLGEMLARIYAERAANFGSLASVRARAATRLLIEDLARVGVPVAAQQRLVDWMAGSEVRFVQGRFVAAVGR